MLLSHITFLTKIKKYQKVKKNFVVAEVVLCLAGMNFFCPTPPPNLTHTHTAGVAAPA
jgi:hypothetical protein